MSSMFSNTKTKTLDLSSFDTSKVTNMNFLFSLSDVETVDMSSFDFSNVQNNGDNCMISHFTREVTVYVKNETDINKIKELDKNCLSDSSLKYNTIYIVK